MLILLSLLVTTVAYGSRVTDCPCVPPQSCGTTPYGSHTLDVLTFGIIPPCPLTIRNGQSVVGTVRCCPRDDTEKKLTARNLIEQLSNPSADSSNMDEQLSNPSVASSNMDVECDCVQQGLCLEHFVTADSDCNEFEELCCIPHSDVNAAVQLFIDEFADDGDNENTDAVQLFNDELADNGDIDNTDVVQLFIDELEDDGDNENTDPLRLVIDELEDDGDNDNTDALSMHDSTIHEDGIGVSDNTDNTAISPKPRELQDNIEEVQTVPCVPGLMCVKLYGFHPLDIARFGVLPHCSRRGFVRCVELKAPSSSQPHLFTHEEGYHDAYILPCVLVNKCDKIYGFDPLDIAKFGGLPHCARRGFVRCVQVKNTTGSTSNTSPSVISDMSSSASPSVISEMSSSASPSVISEMSSTASPSVTQNIEAQLSSTSPSLTSLIISDTEAQSSLAGDYQTHENGNIDLSSSDMEDVSDEGNSNIDERAAIVDLKPLEMEEFTPIELDSNNVISEVENLQVLIPTELMRTDIHKLIQKHLALRVGSTEIRPNSVDPDIVSLIAQVIKSNELMKRDSYQDSSKFVKPDNKKDESRIDNFEMKSFKDIVSNQNDQTYLDKMDHVKDAENLEN